LRKRFVNDAILAVTTKSPKLLDLPSITIAKVDVVPLRARGGVSPKMALGLMNERPALLIRIEDNQGAYGWGEIWANFPPRANLHKAHLVEDVIVPRVIGRRFAEPSEIGGFLRASLRTYFLHIGQLRVFEHLLAGIDLALWDLVLRAAGRSAAEHFGLKRPFARVYASSINPEDADEMVAQHWGAGETLFKLKLGFGEDRDTAFVMRVAEMLPDGARFAVDPNQTWDVETSHHIIRAIAERGPAFVEEPIPADRPSAEWESLVRIGLPIAGGENLYGREEFSRLIDAGLTFVQPDIAKWGGLSGALDLAENLPSGVGLWPHFMGTSVGQVAALTVSAIVGPDSTCEMDVNRNVLRTDLSGNVLEISDGSVGLPTAPGLTVPPNPDELARYTDLTFTPHAA